MEYSDLSLLDGVACEIGSDKPYSGSAVAFHKNGALRARAEFRNGRLEGTLVAFFDNGQPQLEARFRGGLPVGQAVHHTSDGRIVWIVSFRDGLLDGSISVWSIAAESLRLEGTCAGGVPHGAWVQYHEDGTPESALTFEHGRLVGDVLSWFPGNRPRVRGSIDSAGQGHYSLFGSDGQCYETGWFIDWTVVDVVSESRAPTRSLSRFTSFVDQWIKELRDPIPRDLRLLARPPN